MINDVTDKKNFEQLLENSHEKPVFLLKHSTACGVSAVARREFSRFAEDNEAAEFWQVLVRENRPLSLLIANQTGIDHQSPQVILFERGRPVWNDSHLAITVDNLKNRLAGIKISGQ